MNELPYGVCQQTAVVPDTGSVVSLWYWYEAK